MCQDGGWKNSDWFEHVSSHNISIRPLHKQTHKSDSAWHVINLRIDAAQAFPVDVQDWWYQIYQV